MKKIKLSVCLVALGFVLAACGGNESAKKESSSASDATEETMITVQDVNGDVKVPQNPERVVVFDMGMLDTIDALGESDAVVGVAKDSLPKYLSKFDSDKVESAGGIKEPDFEKINALKPDLIIISGRQADSLEELQKIAPTLYLETDDAALWNSINENVSTIGTIFDKSDEAKKQLDALSEKIDVLNKKNTGSEMKTLTVLLNEGSLSAYGKGSRFAILNDVFGFQLVDDKIEASTHGQAVSFEYVLEKNPDVLFVIDRTKAIGGDTSKNNLTENELIKQTNAAKNDKIVMLDPEVWYLSGGGLISTEMMLEEVSNVTK